MERECSVEKTSLARFTIEEANYYRQQTEMSDTLINKKAKKEKKKKNRGWKCFQNPHGYEIPFRQAMLKTYFFPLRSYNY